MTLEKIEKRLKRLVRKAYKQVKHCRDGEVDTAKVILPADDVDKMQLYKMGYLYKGIPFDIFVGPKDIFGDDIGLITVKYKEDPDFPKIVYGPMVPYMNAGMIGHGGYNEVNILTGEQK